MNCSNCNYALWNLRARMCPECGTSFRVRDFEFVPNAVRFCCPNCEQPYYGTGAHGHLVPQQFTCVKCQRPVAMDDMVLLPTEGLTATEATRRVPWEERGDRGFFKAWFATIGSAMTSPGKLARGMSSHRVGPAWRFAVTTITATFIVALVPTCLFMMVLPAMIPSPASGGSGGPTPGQLVALMAGMTVVGTLFGFFFVFAGMCLWGLLAHGLLRMTGTVAGTIGRTYQCICYGSGAFAATVLPCAGQYVGSVWWLVSAVIITREAQQVSGRRASFALITPPVVLIGSIIALYIVGTIALLTTAASTRIVLGGGTQLMTTAIEQYASADPAGRGPVHGLELLSLTPVTEYDFVDSSSRTTVTDVPLDGGRVHGVSDLQAFTGWTPAEQAATIARAVAAQPADVVAHRVGDFVFVHHGMTFPPPDPGLWTVVMVSDPVLHVKARLYEAGRADGTIGIINRSSFPAALQTQNLLRAAHGLPPIPDPFLVRHEQPVRETGSAP